MNDLSHISDVKPLGLSVRNAFKFFGMDIDYDDLLYARKVGDYFKFGTQSDFRADPTEEHLILMNRIKKNIYSDSIAVSELLFALTYLWDLKDVEPDKRHFVVEGREAMIRAARMAFFH